MITNSSECLLSGIGNRTPKSWIVPVLFLGIGLGSSCSSPEAVADSSALFDAAQVTEDAGVQDASVDAAAPAGDSLPKGAVSYFNRKSCPDGWVPFAMGAGRSLVAAASPAAMMNTDGKPLLDGEDRVHAHTVNGSVTIPSVNYAGIAGEANHGVARAGTTAMTVVTGSASAGIPYVQLLACQKMVEPDLRQRPAASGMLMFFMTTECPLGWVAAGLSQGRFLVGKPDIGNAGQTFGGPPLAAAQPISHVHQISGTIKTTSHGIALASGGAAGNYAKDDSHRYQFATQAESVAMPSLQLRQCQKR